MGCFCKADSAEDVAIVAKFKKTGQANSKDCELLSLSRFIKVVPPQSIVKTVSIIHECTDLCTVERTTTIAAEREDIQTDKYYSITHDFTNNLYCLNKYCMCDV